jgi:hypothetical protein
MLPWQAAGPRPAGVQTLKRKCSTSPSWTT